MKIGFSNDHAGVVERGRIMQELKNLGHEVIDYGTSDTKSVNYPEMAEPAVRALVEGTVDRVVLMCGTGIGMSMVANRVPGVRCAVVTDKYGAELSRRHNDANCLALRCREIDPAVNDELLKTWLETPFEGGRHAVRVKLIDEVGERLESESERLSKH
jgi:ribose 5-phosphate isomerase B